MSVARRVPSPHRDHGVGFHRDLPGLCGAAVGVVHVEGFLMDGPARGEVGYSVGVAGRPPGTGSSFAAIVHSRPPEGF